MLLAIAVAAAVAGLADPADGFRHFASPAFERFAATTDRLCPDRHLAFVTPADLDLIEEDFVAAQPRRDRRRIGAVDAGPSRCAGHNGLTCPTMATMDALAATNTLDRFAAFACTAPNH